MSYNGSMALFESRIFRKWRPDTNVLPKRGMLVQRHRDLYDYSDHERPYVLIVDVVVDDYRRCKFQYLGENKTEWTDWMTRRYFNTHFNIQNPWI